MRINWDRSIDSVLLWEGSWTGPRPQEPGGYAMRGVSYNTFKAWRKKQGKPVPSPEDLKNHPESETREIYRDEFANKIGFDTLPSGYDCMSLHAAVMFGPGFGVPDDEAHPGWADLHALAKGDMGLLCTLMMRAKMHRIDCGPTTNKITGKPMWLGKGWSDRFLAVYRIAKAIEQKVN